MVRLCAAAFVELVSLAASYAQKVAKDRSPQFVSEFLKISGLAMEDAQDDYQSAENEKDGEQKALSHAVFQCDATHDVLEVRSI
jgi:hypothetical protein